MNDDELDQEIRSALEARPSQDQIARLERFWNQQSRSDRRRRVVRGMAIAASILLAGTLSAWTWLPKPVRAPQARAATPETARAIDSAHPAIAARSADKGGSLDRGRPPTPYEQLIFVAHQTTPAPPRLAISTAVIDRLIATINRDPTADIQRLAESEGFVDSGPEAMLLRRLKRCDANDEDALLRLLAVCGSKRSLPVVLRLGRQPAFRDQAVTVVERIMGVAGLAETARHTMDPPLRRALIARLLVTQDERALRGYLSLLHEEDLRADALAVAETLPSLPLASLVALLEDEQKPVRVAAAMVLGHVNGPEISASLIQLVTGESSDNTEAWMALLACRGERAKEFVAFATFRPQLLGRINNARVQMAQMISLAF